MTGSTGQFLRLTERLNDRNRKETTMYSHRIARDLHLERQREIERRLRFRPLGRVQEPRSSVRRRLGRSLIHIGLVLAPDAPLQLSARR